VQRGTNSDDGGRQHESDGAGPDERHADARQTGAENHADFLAGRSSRARLAALSCQATARAKSG
jgi:hypothetical protein